MSVAVRELMKLFVVMVDTTPIVNTNSVEYVVVAETREAAEALIKAELCGDVPDHERHHFTRINFGSAEWTEWPQDRAGIVNTRWDAY